MGEGIHRIVNGIGAKKYLSSAGFEPAPSHEEWILSPTP